LAVLKGDKTSNELAGVLGVHPAQLSEWKKQFVENGTAIFEKAPKKSNSNCQIASLTLIIDRYLVKIVL